MGRPREPIELIAAKGNKHLTKAEIAARKASEVKAPPALRIRVPDYVPEDLRKEFRKLARQLAELGIYADMDADSLARYVIAESYYLHSTAYVAQALAKGDSELAAEWGGIQDRYFKQATACARDLGLTISSRCKLVVPQAAEAEEDPDAALFG